MSSSGSYGYGRSVSKSRLTRNIAMTDCEYEESSGSSSSLHRMNRRRSRSPLIKDSYDDSIHDKGSACKKEEYMDSLKSHAYEYEQTSLGDDSGYWPDAFDQGRNEGRGSGGDKERANHTCNKRHREDEDGSKPMCSISSKTKKVPWVPPPLPEHLRHLPTSLLGNQNFPFTRQHGQPPQNQFQNDGSFMEVFRQKMRDAEVLEKARNLHFKDATISANSNTNSVGVSSQVPRRRITKVLKTGMMRKQKKNEPDAVAQRDQKKKGKDVWSSYMNEVQKYSANKFIDTDACRPLLK